MSVPHREWKRCENPSCRRLDETVRYDRGWRTWLCNDCWRDTRPAQACPRFGLPPEAPRRPTP